MLSVSAYILCILLSFSLTILGAYAISFFNFLNRREENYPPHINELFTYNYQDREQKGELIDILDYMEIEDDVYVERDAYLDDLSSRQLVYSKNLNLWIKK
jgi:hypothetical protein